MLRLQGILVKMYMRNLFPYCGLVPVLLACAVIGQSYYYDFLLHLFFKKTVVCDERRLYAQVACARDRSCLVQFFEHYKGVATGVMLAH